MVQASSGHSNSDGSVGHRPIPRGPCDLGGLLGEGEFRVCVHEVCLVFVKRCP